LSALPRLLLAAALVLLLTGLLLAALMLLVRLLAAALLLLARTRIARLLLTGILIRIGIIGIGHSSSPRGFQAVPGPTGKRLEMKRVRDDNAEFAKDFAVF
jgi:hypothetical protein